MPAEKNVSAAMNTLRVWNRCSRNPVTGMTTAMVSRKAVVSHWAALAVTPRSVISRGSATDMIVSLRIIVKVDTSRSAITTRLRAE